MQKYQEVLQLFVTFAYVDGLERDVITRVYDFFAATERQPWLNDSPHGPAKTAAQIIHAVAGGRLSHPEHTWLLSRGGIPTEVLKG